MLLAASVAPSDRNRPVVAVTLRTLAQHLDLGRGVLGAVDRRAGHEDVGAGVGGALDGLGA